MVEFKYIKQNTSKLLFHLYSKYIETKLLMIWVDDE